MTDLSQDVGQQLLAHAKRQTRALEALVAMVAVVFVLGLLSLFVGR